MLSSNTTKDLPNTHRRSTTETAMNPIGQAFPVIHMHLVGNSDHALCTPFFGTVSSLLQSVDSHGLWGGLTDGLPSTLGSAKSRFERDRTSLRCPPYLGALGRKSPETSANEVALECLQNQYLWTADHQ